MSDKFHTTCTSSNEYSVAERNLVIDFNNNNHKIKKCDGFGQGSCKRCSDMGKWNRIWMCFLYKVDGFDGIYCEDCAKYLANREIGKKK